MASTLPPGILRWSGGGTAGVGSRDSTGRALAPRSLPWWLLFWRPTGIELAEDIPGGSPMRWRFCARGPVGTGLALPLLAGGFIDAYMFVLARTGKAASWVLSSSSLYTDPS